MKLQEFSLFYYCIWLFTFVKMSIPQYHPISLYHSDIISWGAFCKVFICRLQLNFQIFATPRNPTTTPRFVRKPNPKRLICILKIDRERHRVLIFGFFTGKIGQNEPRISDFQNLPKTRPIVIFTWNKCLWDALKKVVFFRNISWTGGPPPPSPRVI